jgi:dTDP-4-amino-4,6-dideoxygalactose transaminase
VKIITTGEGGMSMTNDPILSEKMARFRTHGITRKPDEMVQEFDGPWYYEQQDLGFNYRITDIQCALGLSQLSRLEAFVERRRKLADQYDTALKSLPVITPHQSSTGISAWHLYVVQIDETNAGKSRREVFDGLRERGIGANVHYIPVHTQPYYRNLGFKPGQFPVSERYYARTISLPMYAGLTDAEQERVVEALRSVLGSTT